MIKNSTTEDTEKHRKDLAKIVNLIFVSSVASLHCIAFSVVENFRVNHG
jgi:hypothetical protein